MNLKFFLCLMSVAGASVDVNGGGLDRLAQFRVEADNRVAVRQSFGIVFQDSSLDDNLTAYENMEFHAVLYYAIHYLI